MPFPIFPDVAPANYTMGLRGNRRTSPSPTAALQVSTFRPGARWAINAPFGILGDASREDRARLNRAISFVDGVQERGDYFWYYPRQRTLGQMSRESLLAQGSGYLQTNRDDPVSLWNTSGGTSAVRGYRLELRAGAVLEQAVATVAGQTYSVTGEYHIDPAVGSSASISVGAAAGGSELLSVTLSDQSVGRFTHTFVASGATASLSLQNTDVGSIYFSQVAVASAAQVRLAASAGEGVCSVEGLPPSNDQALLVGDLVEINGELKRLRSDLAVFGAGTGDVSFSPNLRADAPAGAPIIIHRPSVLMQAAPTDIQYNRAGMGTFTLQMSEVFPRSTG